MRNFRKEAKAVQDIVREYRRAVRTNGPFHSAHEGYAVILEEMDELKTEIWKKPKNRSMTKMRKEAAQIGAVALRLIVDFC